MLSIDADDAGHDLLHHRRRHRSAAAWRRRQSRRPQAYTGPIALNANQTITARLLQSNGAWSAWSTSPATRSPSPATTRRRRRRRRPISWSGSGCSGRRRRRPAAAPTATRNGTGRRRRPRSPGRSTSAPARARGSHREPGARGWRSRRREPLPPSQRPLDLNRSCSRPSWARSHCGLSNLSRASTADIAAGLDADEEKSRERGRSAGADVGAGRSVL